MIRRYYLEYFPKVDNSGVSYKHLELYEAQIQTAENPSELKNRPLTESEKHAAEIEVKAIYMAEIEGNLQRALELLNEAITIDPSYPSSYNNRAQLYRLLKRNSEAYADLEKAVELSLEFPTVKRQALCQRAWLKYAEDKNDEALVDFEESGKLGCRDAKLMAVKCNPYARLCNDIMQGMLQRLYYSNPQ